MQIGIVGLPNVGKSTLFNALTRGQARVAKYPFTTIECNLGVVEVPDKRLAGLKEYIGAEEVIPATIKFVDIAGLVKGASRGEGLGNQFLAKIREVEAIIHLVRCFTDPRVARIAPDSNPKSDIEIINLELNLADLALIERRKERIKKDPGAKEELKLLHMVIESLGKGEVLKLDKEKQEVLGEHRLLSLKPILYVANLSEGESIPGDLKEYHPTGICARLESEVQELAEEEAAQFRKEMGIEGSGLEKIIKASYSLLNLVTFFTIERKKLRAWTLKAGRSVREAAGKIHSDMERGFIKAEVIGYADLVRAGSLLQAREKGLLRIEGEDYRVAEGDIVTIKFRA